MANTKVTSNVIADNAVGITQLNVSDGSAGQFLKTDGSGSLSFATVTGTTINNNADNRVITGSGTANRLEGETNFVFNGTNVGIGTTSPSRQLTVENSSDHAIIGAVSGTSSLAGMVMGDTDDDDRGAVLYNNNGNYMYIQTDASERMRIDSSGKVHIGATSGTGILNVDGGSGEGSLYVEGTASGSAITARLLASDGGAVFFGSNTNHDLRIQTNGSNRMTIDSSGKVSIGQTTGFGRLTVNSEGAPDTSGNVTSGIVVCNTAGGNAIKISVHDSGALNYIQSGYVNNIQVARNFAIFSGASESFRIDTTGKIGMGGITSPAQNFVVGTTTNYDPPGLGSSNANFAILNQDGAAAGKYGLITGISSDGNVWSQVQRTDGTATAYNYYLQPSGGSVGIGIPQNHTYIPNLTVPFRVGKVRSGTGNDTDYLTKMSIDAIGYAGSNYQFGAIDFTGGDTAGASGNHYGRIGCSSMVGTNNQETGSLEFYVKAPSFGMSGTTHAMKITGKADTGSAGGGTSRNGVLFTYQGIAIDRTWSDYPGISVLNATPYSSTASTQSELRIHGTNMSSASYPGTSGSDFSVVVRSDGGYATGSDKRRKKNITTISDALSKVKQLTGRRFQTINRSNTIQAHVSKNKYKFGFIAQEVEDIIPEAVIYHAAEDDGTENWNSAYAMDYGSVVALLVNAIKEQDVIIEDLKSRIETLEG